jgi:hypothetical protein
MARVASFFKWFALTVWSLLIAPFILHAWNGALDRGDVTSHPLDFAMGWLASFAQVPGVYVGALIATGVVVGAWIDWLLRKFDGSRSADRKNLGSRFCNLAHNIENRFQYQGEWPSNIHDLVPNLMSAFIEAEWFGLWTPVDQLYSCPDGGTILVNYLRIVGVMLRDGHFEQAKKRALQTRAFVAQQSNPAISP